MIQPSELDLQVQRNAAFPSIDPISFTDDLTGAPIDISGATFEMEVRESEGHDGAPLLSKTLTVLNGPSGLLAYPAVSEAEHKALIAPPAVDGRTLQSRTRLRYDIKASGVSGWPSSVVVMRGFYDVQTGVTL